MRTGTLLVIAGFAREQRVAAGRRTRIVLSGADPKRLAERLDREPADGIAAVISFGIAGGLAPELRPGDVVLASTILAADQAFGVDEALSARITALLPNARTGALAGVDRPVMTAAAKLALRARLRADAVDMESHVAAAFALRHALPFVALRAISDAADRALPPLATNALSPDGRLDWPAILGAIARNPGQIPALVRTGRETNRAFAALKAARAALSPLFD